MRALVRVSVLAATAALLTAPAAAADRHDSFPLHSGSTGARVAGVQWMLSGHCPNKFASRCGGKVKPTLHAYTPRVYGVRTKAAVKAMKYRIGYPAKGQCGASRTAVTDTAGRTFVLILEGKKQRPLCWVAVAQQRVQLVERGATPIALKIKAWEVSQLGNAETSWNCGPSINAYFTYLHLPCGLAWCEIFQANGFGRAGYLPVPFALGARSPYGVISTEQWAAAHGYVSAKAKVGSLVAFLDDGGHIGYVVKVLASGYVTIEGNEGNRVQQVYHAWNYRLRVFINMPGVA